MIFVKPDKHKSLYNAMLDASHACRSIEEFKRVVDSRLIEVVQRAIAEDMS